jgi:ParB-like nuclease domain
MNAPLPPMPQLRPLTLLPPEATLLAHPLAEADRMMTDDELEGLKTSIKASGIRQPIVLFEGKILDGRNRFAAATAIGYKFAAADFVEFIGTREAAKAHAKDTNVHRRHLTTEDKTKRVEQMFAEHPSASDRNIAKACGVSHSFVGKLRKPEGDPKFDKFSKAWDDLSDQQREKFVTQFEADLRELFG